MPTQIFDFIADAQSYVRMRWREPYVSEGLNRKQVGIEAKGVHRGFILRTADLGYSVIIANDPDREDSIAVYETGGGHSYSIRKTSAELVYDLTAGYASKTVAIALYATYEIGNPSTACIRVYEVAPTNELAAAPERDELVILGQVVVPATGPIPAANVSHTGRTAAWENQSAEAMPWTPLVANGSFEQGAIGECSFTWESLPNWYMDWSGNVKLFVVASAASSGRRSLEVRSNSAGAITISDLLLAQYVNFPVFPGERLKVTFKYQALVANTTGGSGISIALAGVSEETASPSSATILSEIVSLGTASTDWKTFEQIIEVPAGMGYVTGLELYNRGGNLTFGTPGSGVPLFRIDDVQVFVETNVRDLRSLERARYAFAHLSGIVWRNLWENFVPGGADNLADVLLNFGPWLRDGSSGLQLRNLDNGFGSSQPGLDIGGTVTGGAGWDNSPEANAQPDFRSYAEPHATTAEYSLIWEGRITSYAEGIARIYLYYTGSFNITLNARWNAATDRWVGDVASANATRVIFDPTYVTFQFHYNDATPWQEVDWWVTPSSGFNLDWGWNADPGPFLQFIGEVGNPPADYEFLPPNALLAKNLVRAWGYIATGTTPSPPTVYDGFNIASVEYVGPEGVRVYFTLPCGSYGTHATVCSMQFEDPFDGVRHIASRSGPMYVDFRASDLYGTGIVLPSTYAVFSFLVLGSGLS